MANPHCAGATVLVFEAAPRKLRIEETHNILLGTARRVSIPEDNLERIGIGFLDIAKAVEAARSVAPAGRPFKQITVRLPSSVAATPVKAAVGSRTSAASPAAAQGESEGGMEAQAAPLFHAEAVGRLGPCPDVPAPHRRLALGSTDPAVREAQRKLNVFHVMELTAGHPGLADAPLVPDCIFGPHTFNAVKAFQQRVFPGQPKEWDGIIGPKTWAQLDLVPGAAPLPPAPPLPNPPAPIPPVPGIVFDTSPQHWFLTRAEILAARGNAETRPGLGEFTSQNLAEPLIDGAEMMRALQADLAAVGPGDFFHITSWRLNISQDLTPSGSASTASPSRFDNLVKSLAGKGARARALIWQAGFAGLAPALTVSAAPIVPASTMVAHVGENTQARDFFNSVGGKGVIDARFPIFGAHHQKSAIVLRAGEAVAYCGGIDICPDRWDTQKHDSDKRRTKESVEGWHDVHVRLRGPAVLEIEQNFRERWNAKEQPCIRCIPAEPVPPPITDPLPPVSSAPGTHHVQVLRTYACIHDHYHEFAPLGETTIRAAYLKAIALARNYIYIEDQYLVSEELALALAAALDTAKKLIILVPPETDAPAPDAFNFHQAKFIRIVTARHPDKVHIFHPVQPATGASIYVHAKVMIIDDVYAVIGSPNVNRRGMSHDTELAAAVVDGDIVDGVCRYARDLRRRLWGEHLNVAPTDPVVADPILAVAEWERQAAAASFRVRHHVTPAPQIERRRFWDNAADPDGQCPTTVAPGTTLAVAKQSAVEAAENVAAAQSMATSFLDVAEYVVTAHRASQTRAPIWSDMLTVSGFGQSLRDPATGRMPSAAESFDALTFPTHTPLRAQLEDHFELVAAPGCAPIAPLRAGDIIIRRSEGSHVHVAVLGAAELRERESLHAEGLQMEAGVGGRYAPVVEGGAVSHRLGEGFARRITGEGGLMPSNQMVLRARGVPASPERFDPTSLLVGVTLASSMSRPAAPVVVTTAAPPTRTTDPDGTEIFGEGAGDRCPPDRPDTITGFPQHSSAVADLPQSERDKLAALAQTLANSPARNPDNPFDTNPQLIIGVRIVGGADSDPLAERREPGFAQAVSEQRADAVCRDLIGRLNPDKASQFNWIRIGRGAQDLAVPGARTERERLCNRRVTVTLINNVPPKLEEKERILAGIDQELFQTFYHAALQATSGLREREPRLAESEAREIADSTVEAYRARVGEFLEPNLKLTVPIPFITDALSGTASKPGTAREIANRAIDIAKVAHVGPFLELRRLEWKFAKLPQPMSPDCEIQSGKLTGPANHALCSTHGHVMDTTSRMVIAHSIDEYKSGKFTGGAANLDEFAVPQSEAVAGGWIEQAPVASGPFASQAYGPQMIRDSQRTQDLLNAIAAVKATLSTADQRRLDQVAFAIAKLGTGNNPVEYAGLHEDAMFFTGSLAKIALLPASFELLFRVQQQGVSSSAIDPKAFLADVHKSFDSTIRASISWLPPGDWRETKIEDVVTATKNASGGFDVVMNAVHRRELERIFSDPNNNGHLRSCMRRLGYSYVNGATAAGGFLGTDPLLSTFKKGLWMANDLGGGWPQFFVPVQTGGKSSVAGTAIDIANILTAMHRGTLIDATLSGQMMSIFSTGASWLMRVPASVGLALTNRGAKVGHASSDDAHAPTVKSEAAFLERGGALFATVWHNFPDAHPDDQRDVSIVYRVIDEVARLWP
jgi:phosphatidylserine/phosphatidylglycerophosphate/cardiolipin synthase-like enzyme